MNKSTKTILKIVGGLLTVGGLIALWALYGWELPIIFGIIRIGRRLRTIAILWKE